MNTPLSNVLLPTVAHPVSASWSRRLGEVSAFVLAYVGLSFALKLDTYAYLVLGIPLAIAFQRFVARVPLRAAWIADAPAFVLDRRTVIFAILLALVPALSIVNAVATRSWTIGAQLLAGIAGAVAAAYAIRKSRGRLARTVLTGLAAAIPGILVMAVASRLNPSATHKSLGTALFIGVFSFAQYVPIAFAVEEVVFRGVLDAHVMRGISDRKRAWATALFVSALWGAWHSPLVPGVGAGTVAILIGVHVVAGLPITASWRRTGTLLAPVIAHSLVNAVRNALM